MNSVNQPKGTPLLDSRKEPQEGPTARPETEGNPAPAGKTSQQELILQIQATMSDINNALTETDLWNLIAASSSPDWRVAKETLDAAEHLLQERHDPSNIPLGLVGHALEGPDINAMKNKVTASLAYFTVINEHLRQREDLSRVFGMFAHQCAASAVRQEEKEMPGTERALPPAPQTGGFIDRMFRLAAKKLQKSTLKTAALEGVKSAPPAWSNS